MSPGLFGLLDESQFNFTSLDNENSYEGFPSSIQVQLQIFEIYLNLTLNATSMMNKQIYTKDYTSSEISQNELKLVYFSSDSCLRKTHHKVIFVIRSISFTLIIKTI